MKKILGMIITGILIFGCGNGAVSRPELEQQIQELEEQASLDPDNWDVKEEWLEKLVVGGFFQEAEELLESLMRDGENLSFEAKLQAAQLSYLRGDFAASERILLDAKKSTTEKWNLIMADIYLCYVYYQTDRYDTAQNLFTGSTELSVAQERILGDNLSLWRFMTMVESEPYQIDWQGHSQAVIPFLPGEDWELPRVNFSINDRNASGFLDTGGDMLIIPWDLAEQAGVQVMTSGTGYYAAGEEREHGYGVARRISMGDIVLYNVPVEIGPSNEPIIGTALLRHFLPTLDFPGHRLILNPKSQIGLNQFQDETAHGTTESIPFYLYATHLILAHGSLDQREDLLFFMDSGLEDPRGASLTLPRETIELLNYSLPKTETEMGESGAGTVEMEIGYLNMDSLGLAGLEQRNPRVIYGPFPPQLHHEALGFMVDGILSHHFLKDYAWTLDFTRQTMYFTY